MKIMIGSEKGDVDLVLIFLLVFILSVGQWTVMGKIGEAWRMAYQALEDDLQNPDGAIDRSFSAFGRSFTSPLPRIDYGAYYQKQRDAEALCIIGRDYLLASDWASFRCE